MAPSAGETKGQSLVETAPDDAPPKLSPAERATQLAADRTVFAAERTYAAWVRTGLAALASGVGAKKVLEGVVPEWAILLMGALLVAFSAFCFGAAIWRNVFTGAAPPTPDTRRIPAWVLLPFNGVLMLVAFGVLLTILFGETGGD